MSDPREALVQAMLSYDANGLREVPSAHGWAEHVADAVLREFLVMPRITFTEPATPADWVQLLERSQYMASFVDRDGDIWTRRGGDGQLEWKRHGGGWSCPVDMVQYAPFRELDPWEAPEDPHYQDYGEEPGND